MNNVCTALSESPFRQSAIMEKFTFEPLFGLLYSVCRCINSQKKIITEWIWVELRSPLLLLIMAPLKDLITYYIFMKANKLQNLQCFMKLQSLDEETTSYNTPWAHVECVWWCLMFAGRWKDQRTALSCEYLAADTQKKSTDINLNFLPQMAACSSRVQHYELYVP